MCKSSCSHLDISSILSINSSFEEDEGREEDLETRLEDIEKEEKK